ncbi:MAG: hypothetical protein IJZ00_08620 [Lachnospiraceae bacterium]|nr:hypothetical protein [Lachnospiraceae bacterium]
MAKSYLDKMRDIVKKAEEAQKQIDKIESQRDKILNLLAEAYEVCDEQEVDARIDTFVSQTKEVIEMKRRASKAAKAAPQVAQNVAPVATQTQ